MGLWYPGFGSYWDDNMESERDDPKWLEDYLRALGELKFQDRHGKRIAIEVWYDNEYVMYS